MTSMTKTILVIGRETYPGPELVHGLKHLGYSVRLLECCAAAGSIGGIEPPAGDIADPAVLAAACSDVFAIVDLSQLGDQTSGDVARATAAAVARWQAARQAGVQRIVTLVSDGIVGFYRRSEVLDHYSLPRPDGAAGVVGALSEALGALYACKYGMSTLSIRMGSCMAEPADERMLSTWISPADLMRLVKVALTADYCFEIVYGVSANAHRWWDNANAARLGYRPLDKAEAYAEGLRGRRSANLIENVFQGGSRVAEDFAGDIRRIR